jgi:hypothetical protein
MSWQASLSRWSPNLELTGNLLLTTVETLIDGASLVMKASNAKKGPPESSKVSLSQPELQDTICFLKEVASHRYKKVVVSGNDEWIV